MLRSLGCRVEGPQRVEFGGMPMSLFPRVLLRPSSFAVLSRVAAVFPSPHNVRITERSTLVVEGPGTVVVESLDLDGALWVRATHASAKVVVRRCQVVNRGVRFEAPPRLVTVEEDAAVAVRAFRKAVDSEWRVVEAKLMNEVVVVQDL